MSLLWRLWQRLISWIGMTVEHLWLFCLICLISADFPTSIRCRSWYMTTDQPFLTQFTETPEGVAFIRSYFQLRAMSVHRSDSRSVPHLLFGILQAVFASALLPNQTLLKLILSCVRHPSPPLPTTLLGQPYHTRLMPVLVSGLLVKYSWCTATDAALQEVSFLSWLKCMLTCYIASACHYTTYELILSKIQAWSLQYYHVYG